MDPGFTYKQDVLSAITLLNVLKDLQHRVRGVFPAVSASELKKLTQEVFLHWTLTWRPMGMYSIRTPLLVLEGIQVPGVE